MTLYQFTVATRRHGLYRKGIGLEATRELALLVQKPVPVIKPTSWHDRSVAPSCLKWMGKLIAAGLARLNPDAKQYEATDDGRQWLAKLAKHNLLPS